VGPWSAGTKTVETSILNAYMQMIEAAKYYVYIEVHLFCSIYSKYQSIGLFFSLESILHYIER
jgi:hypothetical protein